nr:tetratricopeptide repeat protein [Rhizohabitans arisaemae]
MPAGVSIVSGPPGVGKTALAVHWAHRVRDEFPDGDLYIDMQGFATGAPLSTEVALDAFLRCLQVPPEDIPDTLAGRSALFRSLLDGKRALILVDNASSSAQVRHLIPGSHRCFTLVTSRNTLSGLVVREGALPVTLDVLSPEESVLLLSEVIGADRVRAEQDIALRVAQLCGCLPLALRVVGERAVGRPLVSLKNLLDELIGEQRRLDELASVEDELSDTRAVFSWSYQALTPELMRAFRLLGLFEGREIGVGAAAALIGVGMATAKRQLQALTGVHLLQEVSANRFQFHALLRLYSRERAFVQDSQMERTKAVRRLLSWYLLTSNNARSAILPFLPQIPLVPANQIDLVDDYGSAPEAMAWFDVERPNILAAMRQAIELGQFDIGWKLAFVTTGFFELRSYWKEWEENHRNGLAAAVSLGDGLGEAVNLLMLGDIAWRSRRFDESMSSYQRAAEVGRSTSEGWVEGFALRGQGLICEERGDFNEASELFQSSLRIFRSTGFRRGEGMSLLSLGRCERAIGDLAQAVALGAEAVRIFDEIGDIWTSAWGRLSLAEILMEMGSDADAMEILRMSGEVFREFEDHRSEAQALLWLGELLLRQNDKSGARECWSRVLEIYESLGDPDTADIRNRMDGLGVEH